MTGEWSTIETVLSEPHAQLQRRVLSDWAFRREGGNSSDLTNNAQETTSPQSIWSSTLRIEEEEGSRHVLNLIETLIKHFHNTCSGPDLSDSCAYCLESTLPPLSVYNRLIGTCEIHILKNRGQFTALHMLMWPNKSCFHLRNHGSVYHLTRRFERSA